MEQLNNSGLTSREYRRYARQLILPAVGIEGQARLKEKGVLVIGSGGLGSPVLQYLAAAGVGRIGIVDHDRVDESNLHRQVLFDYDSLGQPKAEAAARRLQKLNPDTQLFPFDTRLCPDNAVDLVSQFDLVIDCCDNFSTRYLVNDACLICGKPYVYASIYQFEGLLTLFCTEDGPCYRCAFPEPPPAGLVPSCAEGGVLGALPGVFGTLQAAEAIKYLLGFGESLAGRLLQIDVSSASFNSYAIAKNPHCAACSNPLELQLPASDPAPVCQSATLEEVIGAASLSQRLRDGEVLKLIDVRSQKERDVTRIGNDLHIPLGELEQAAIELPKDVPIVTYCLSGVRSRKAADILRTRGYVNVKSLAGGVLAWNAL